MDRKQQAERVRRIVEVIAQKAIEVPRDNRPAYIKNEIAKVREAFHQTYEADERLAASAMELVDSMYSWIKAQVKTLELSGSSAKDI